MPQSNTQNAGYADQAFEGLHDTFQDLWNMMPAIGKGLGLLLHHNRKQVQDLYNQLSAGLASMRNPDARRAAVNRLGELAGGVGGSMAGAGVASPVTAAAGAVVGHALTNTIQNIIDGKPLDALARATQDHMAGRDQQSADDLSVLPAEPVREAVHIGSGYAIPEAGAGLLAQAPRVVPMMRNLVRKPFTPTAEQAAINATADAHGIPLTLGARSGQPIAQQLEVAAEKTPLGARKIRPARQASYNELGKALEENIGNRLHPTAVPPENFQAVAENSLSRQRGAHANDVRAAVDTAGNAIHPAAADAVEGGREAQQAVDAARVGSTLKPMRYTTSCGRRMVTIPST